MKKMNWRTQKLHTNENAEMELELITSDEQREILHAAFELQ
jgi:hypothetical protein